MEEVKFTARLQKPINDKVEKKRKQMGINKNAFVNVACQKMADDISNKELLEEFKKLLDTK